MKVHFKSGCFPQEFSKTTWIFLLNMKILLLKGILNAVGKEDVYKDFANTRPIF